VREIEAARSDAQRDVEQLQARRTDAESRLRELDAQVVVTEEMAVLQEVGVYEYRHPLSDSVAYQAELKRLRDEIKAMTRKDGGAVHGGRRPASEVRRCVVSSVPDRGHSTGGRHRRRSGVATTPVDAGAGAAIAGNGVTGAGGGGGAGAGAGTPVAPLLTKVSVKPTSFRVRKARGAGHQRRVSGGAPLRFTLSAAATVTARVETVPAKGKKARLLGTVALGKGHAGANSVTLTGNVGRRTLAPGRYRLTLTATAGGLTSRAATVTVTVRRG
jgi:hypothetical protein